MENTSQKHFYDALTDLLPNEQQVGFFGATSVSWELYREPIILMGGLRALLLQIAHPVVADGVKRFSNFEEDALGRGFRTFGAMATIYFGTSQQALDTGFGLYKGHGYMQGTYVDKAGEEHPYVANQPEYLAWVLATLTQTTLFIGTHSLKKLPKNWKEQFFEESKRTAALMGIPPEYYPQTLEGFDAYFHKMTTDGTLHISASGKQLAEIILKHPLAMGRFGRWMVAAALPEQLALDFGFQPSAKKTANFLRFLRFMGFLNRLVPRTLRSAPAWHQAQERIAKSKQKSFSLLGRFYYNWGLKTQPLLGIRIKN